MKILGAVLIIIACSIAGFDVYSKNIKKLKYIEGLISGFEFFKSDVSFSHSILGEVFLKSADFAGCAEDFFKNIGTELSKDGVLAHNAFEKYSFNLKNCVNQETFNITKDVILQLGNTDAESQIKLLESGVEKLKNCMFRQEAFCAKEGVMFKKIGVVAGVAISLLLF